MQVILDFVQNTEYAVLVNQIDRIGDTPLHVAANHGNVNIVKVTF